MYRPAVAGVRRATTRAACDALGLPVWDDPAQQRPALQRVRLRHEVLPLLEGVLQGGVAEALARTAALLRDDLDVIDTLVPDVVDHDGAGGQLEVAMVASLPRALRTRVLRAWALGIGATECSAEHTAALDALITDWRGQGPVDLPGGVRVARASERLAGL